MCYRSSQILSTRNAPCKSLGDASRGVGHHDDDDGIEHKEQPDGRHGQSSDAMEEDLRNDDDDLNGAPRGRRVDDGGVSGDTQGDDNDDAIYGRYYDDIVTRVNSQKPGRPDHVTCSTTTRKSA